MNTNTKIKNPEGIALTPAQLRKAEELATVCRLLWVEPSSSDDYVYMRQEPGSRFHIRRDGMRG